MNLWFLLAGTVFTTAVFDGLYWRLIFSLLWYLNLWFDDYSGNTLACFCYAGVNNSICILSLCSEDYSGSPLVCAVLQTFVYKKKILLIF